MKKILAMAITPLFFALAGCDKEAEDKLSNNKVEAELAVDPEEYDAEIKRDIQQSFQELHDQKIALAVQFQATAFGLGKDANIDDVNMHIRTKIGEFFIKDLELPIETDPTLVIENEIQSVYDFLHKHPIDMQAFAQTTDLNLWSYTADEVAKIAVSEYIKDNFLPEINQTIDDSVIWAGEQVSDREALLLENAKYLGYNLSFEIRID